MVGCDFQEGMPWSRNSWSFKLGTQLKRAPIFRVRTIDVLTKIAIQTRILANPKSRAFQKRGALLDSRIVRILRFGGLDWCPSQIVGNY